MVDQSNAQAPIGVPSPPLSAFDARLVEVDIVLPDQTITFPATNPGLEIRAIGSKFGSATQNTCECQIFNLTKELRNQILTLASPLLNPPTNNPASTLSTPRPPVILNLKVGRQSTGLALLFSGNVISCEVTQPPDIGIVLRSLTNNYFNSILLNQAQPATSLLSEIASNIAAQNGLFLDFEANDKQVGNFIFDSVLAKNIEKLNQMINVQAGVDNETLWVINSGSTRKNTGYLISESTGMVGIPQVTSEGVTVRVMINSEILIGGEVTINNTTNQTANGTFKVMKIDYEIATRDRPFWFTLLCSNPAIYQGSTG